MLDQLKEKVIGAASEDKAWLISVLNKHAEIPEFKNVTAFLLGWCYQYGVGVVKDDKEAVRLFSLAAQQGDSDAQFNLGLCYRSCGSCGSWFLWFLPVVPSDGVTDVHVCAS